MVKWALWADTISQKEIICNPTLLDGVGFAAERERDRNITDSDITLEDSKKGQPQSLWWHIIGNEQPSSSTKIYNSS